MSSETKSSDKAAKVPDTVNLLDLFYPIPEGQEGHDLYVKYKPNERPKALRMDQYYKMKKGGAFFATKKNISGARWHPKTVNNQTPKYVIPTANLNEIWLKYNDNEAQRKKPDHSTFVPSEDDPSRTLRVSWRKVAYDLVRLFDCMRNEFHVAHWNDVIGAPADHSGAYFMREFYPDDDSRREYLASVKYGLMASPWTNDDGETRFSCGKTKFQTVETDLFVKKKDGSATKDLKFPRTLIARGIKDEDANVVGFESGSALTMGDVFEILEAGTDGKAKVPARVLLIVSDDGTSFVHAVKQVKGPPKKDQKGPSRPKFIAKRIVDEDDYKCTQSYHVVGMGIVKGEPYVPKVEPVVDSTVDMCNDMLSAAGIGIETGPVASGPSAEDLDAVANSFVATDEFVVHDDDSKKRTRKSTGSAKKRAKKGEE